MDVCYARVRILRVTFGFGFKFGREKQIQKVLQPDAANKVEGVRKKVKEQLVVCGDVDSRTVSSGTHYIH